MARKTLFCFASLALCAVAAVRAVRMAIVWMLDEIRPKPGLLIPARLDGARTDNVRLGRRPRVAWLNKILARHALSATPHLRFAAG